MLVGNSADPTNNHILILEKLAASKPLAINIYVPLSYGNEEYAKKVIQKGYELFANKFIALTNFMPFEEYMKFLSTIDIAIFHHERQQAFGNIISLLSMGKKVYINQKSNLWKYFKSKRIVLFDSNELDLNVIDVNVLTNNKYIVKNLFSIQKLTKELNNLFKFKANNE